MSFHNDGQAKSWLMPTNAVLLFRYWPYLSKVTEESSDFHSLMEMRPFLSVMHAKAHARYLKLLKFRCNSSQQLMRKVEQ